MTGASAGKLIVVNRQEADSMAAVPLSAGTDHEIHHYAGAVRVMTGDAIAAAVVRYAAALHQSGLSDVVAVPTADADGITTTVEILLAPAIAVAIEPAPDDQLEPEDEALLHEVDRRTTAVLSFDTQDTRPMFGH